MHRRSLIASRLASSLRLKAGISSLFSRCFARGLGLKKKRHREGLTQEIPAIPSRNDVQVRNRNIIRRFERRFA